MILMFDKEYYQDWKEDNMGSLKSGYDAGHDKFDENDFEEYCKEEFRREH